MQGREVSYHDETVEEAYESRRQWEAPDWQYDAWVSTYTAIAAGELAEVTDHVLPAHRTSADEPRGVPRSRPGSDELGAQPQAFFFAPWPQ